MGREILVGSEWLRGWGGVLPLGSNPGLDLVRIRWDDSSVDEQALPRRSQKQGRTRVEWQSMNLPEQWYVIAETRELSGICPNPLKRHAKASSRSWQLMKKQLGFTYVRTSRCHGTWAALSDRLVSQTHEPNDPQSRLLRGSRSVAERCPFPQ
jgi:hypothetical protein